MILLISGRQVVGWVEASATFFLLPDGTIHHALINYVLNTTDLEALEHLIAHQ